MKSEFLESELELYVQRLLVHEYYNTGFRYSMIKISPMNERLRGYDAEIRSLTPFYCQFKTSDFLTRGNLYRRRQRFCESLGWPSSPFYSFALRKPNSPSDRLNPRVWQHNILHAFWRANPSAVAYVAPIFHTRAELGLIEPIPLNDCCVFKSNSHPASSISIKNVAVDGHDSSRMPSFTGLISIPPHAYVGDLEHHYCFTTHLDISFHSDPVLVEGGQLFAEALNNFIVSSIRSVDQVRRSEISSGTIRAYLGLPEELNPFFNAFLRFGLIQAGIPFRDIGPVATEIFDQRATFLQRHIALAASLKAYFGITTLGLIRFKER